MLIIYRLSDGKVVSNSGTNSFLPEGPPFEIEVQNAIMAYGGEPYDYGEFRIHDERDAEIVEAIFNAGSYHLLFDDDGKPVGVKTYPRIEVSVSKSVVNPGEEVTVTGSVPVDTGDVEARFFVEGLEEPIVEPIVNGVASHTFVFPDPGRYVISAESDTHGNAVVEVVVTDAGSDG